MLVGVLGGPLGMLLGLGAGALAGSFVDASRLEFGDDIVSDFARTVPPGGNAILAQVTEDGTAALDAFAASVDGVLVRRPVAEVISEIEAQQQAAEAAAEAARKALRDQKRQERQEKAQERLDKIQERFNALKAKFRDEKK
jgi:membrane protein